jgi:hypothetical protein
VYKNNYVPLPSGVHSRDARLVYCLKINQYYPPSKVKNNHMTILIDGGQAFDNTNHLPIHDKNRGRERNALILIINSHNLQLTSFLTMQDRKLSL